VELFVMRVGILGGTGFIGRHLLDAVLQKGWDVNIFTRGRTKPRKEISNAVNWFKGDRNRIGDLKSFFQHYYDVVIDLSGMVLFHVKPILDFYGARIGHYIFCSSVKVYETPTKMMFDEKSKRVYEKGDYGGDKSLTEEILFEYSKENEKCVTVFRPQGVFGEGDAGRQATYVFSRLKNDFPIFVNDNNGSYSFSQIYVKDLVKAFLLSIEKRKEGFEAYNVVSDDVFKQIDFVGMCAEIAKQKPDIRYLRTNVGLSWENFSFVPDNNKIKKDLGLEFSDFGNVLRFTFEWLCENPRFLKPNFSREERFLLENKKILRSDIVRWKIDDVRRKFRENAGMLIKRDYRTRRFVESLRKN
jgi:nucleoside-diphosphate-sugar epimerase